VVQVGSARAQIYIGRTELIIISYYIVRHLSLRNLPAS
jgi:hypothetical protein